VLLSSGVSVIQVSTPIPISVIVLLTDFRYSFDLKFSRN
jgi:hypothetical protein